jgi:hypothetical protein
VKNLDAAQEECSTDLLSVFVTHLRSDFCLSGLAVIQRAAFSVLSSCRERLNNTLELAVTQSRALQGPPPLSLSGSAVSEGLIGWEDCSDLGRNNS